MKLTNPQKQLLNETDEQIRRLERAAAQGDEQAKERLNNLKRKTHNQIQQQIDEGITKTNESVTKFLNLIDTLSTDRATLQWGNEIRSQIYTPTMPATMPDASELAIKVQDKATNQKQPWHTFMNHSQQHYTNGTITSKHSANITN